MLPTLALAGALTLRALHDTTSVKDLPLVDVPAATATGARFAIMLTGDGDWADFVQQVSQRFAAAGIPVVGLKARAYMGRKPSPEQTATDVARIIETYGARWQKSSVVLVGYSRGADWIPFILNRLPAATRRRVTYAAMLGLAERSSFEFRFTDLLRETSRDSDVPIAPELERLRGFPMLCMFGTDEVESGCRGADPGLLTIVSRNGKHHFDRNYDAIAAAILTRLPP
jgi:type IV secretory pathway VirJ component